MTLLPYSDLHFSSCLTDGGPESKVLTERTRHRVCCPFFHRGVPIFIINIGTQVPIFT